MNEPLRYRALEALQRVVLAEHRAGHLYDDEAADLIRHLSDLMHGKQDEADGGAE